MEGLPRGEALGSTYPHDLIRDCQDVRARAVRCARRARLAVLNTRVKGDHSVARERRGRVELLFRSNAPAKPEHTQQQRAPSKSCWHSLTNDYTLRASKHDRTHPGTGAVRIVPRPLIAAHHQTPHAVLSYHLRDRSCLASSVLRVPLPKRPRRAKAPTGPLWRREVKTDGYRMLASKVAGKLRLLSRAGADLTDHFASIAIALAVIPRKMFSWTARS